MGLSKLTERKLTPETYEEWKKNRGKAQQLGIKSFTTDQMYHQHQEAMEKVLELSAKLMAMEMVKAMMYHGQGWPLTLHHERQYNVEVRGWENIFITDGPLVCLQEQYLFRVHQEWTDLFVMLLHWERASLWELVSYWISRTWQSFKSKIKIKRKENDYE